ncbi:hypothetical protein FQA39_LY07682 [Lamprigera yunnana]|nr:hypothetical protein FQA39_LY07682 [Lamprigera yunnana]
MKYIRLYALFFIFSTTFGFNPLLLPEEENKAIQGCVSNIVLREFTENLPIHHVHDGSEPVIMPYVGNNPYVIIDVSKPIKKAEHYASYYIFQTANRSSFKDMYNKMRNYSIWNHFDLREKKCLIIASNSEEIVHELDTSATYIAVYNYTNEIYTCDRYHKGNHCGKQCNVLTKHQCNTNKNYFETTGSLQNCAVDFYLGPYSNHPILNMVLTLILEELTNYLGFSLNIFQPNSTNRKPTGDFTVIVVSTILTGYVINPVYTYELGWVTFVNKIPSTKILQYTFEGSVWILIGLTLLLTLLICCLITKLTGNGWNVETSFTNILALTLVGCLSNLPRLRSLKCLILFYLMFVVIIQTAFKTNLARLLTVDQNDKSIDNLKDLADSNVPLCVDKLYLNLFTESMKKELVYIKIIKRLISIEHGTDILNYRNCTTYTMVANQEKKCLIIASNSEEIVHELDTSATYIAVYNYTNEIYTCDRYHKGNHCGKQCNVLTKHQCNTNKNYFETTGSLQNCAVDFYLGPYSNHPILNMVLTLILEELTNYLGFSLNIFQPNSTNRKPTGDFTVIVVSTILTGYVINPVYTYELGWVTFVNKIPSTKILQYTFEGSVWILIGLTLLLTLLICCLITKLTGNGWNVETSFTNILALTLVGCLSNLPRLRSLKCLILFYLMFVVIIQTAFKTNLARLLTVDQNDKSIDNLKDLADSNVPLCVDKLYLNLFTESMKKELVYIKIIKRLISIEHGTDILNYRNCTYLMYLEHILALKDTTDFRFNYFMNDGSINVKFSPYFLRGNHLIKTLNRVIQRFDENGITKHIISKAKKTNFKRIKEEESEAKVLTMEHVYGIFVIWAVGSALSVMVFLVEIEAFPFTRTRWLTVDQHNKGLQNIADLANSDVPVCIYKDYLQLYFNKPIEKDPVYTKLKEKLISIEKKKLTLKYRNCTYLMFFEEIFALDYKGGINYFINNALVREIIGPQFLKGSYLAKTMNRFLKQFEGNGIIEHVISKRKPSQYDYHKRIKENESEPKVLTMEHLYGIFIIWAVGLALSVIVFLVEIASQKFAKK